MNRLLTIFSLSCLSVSAMACGEDEGTPGIAENGFRVDGIVPASSHSGSVVTVEGTGFSPVLSENSVIFGNSKAEIVSCSRTALSVIVPEHALGEVKVHILCNGRSAETSFTYIREDLYPDYPSTPVGMLFETSCSEVYEVMRDTSYVLAPGVEYTELTLLTNARKQQQIHLVKVSPDGEYTMQVAMPKNSPDISGGWKRQTLTAMTEALEQDGTEVAAMVNGDFWNMTKPINPRGPVHFGGAVVSQDWDYDPALSQQALSFVGVTFDGEPVIADTLHYEEIMPSLKECTGAGVVMVLDGKATSVTYTQRDPRTAVGYVSDGTFWLLTADGREQSGAAGLTYREMAAMFLALGCEAAANLDGGGSAQMLIRDPATGENRIINSPSDGKERSVINGWAVTRKQK